MGGMRLSPRLVPVLLLAASTSLAADPPAALTGWRTAQGIFLSWSSTPPGAWTIWRGTASGALRPLTTLPPGQAGFWDTAVARTKAYAYALGDSRTHGLELEIAGAPPPVRIISGLVTTCSGLTPGMVYPGDSRNIFDPSRDRNVQFFGMFILRPFDPTVREVRIVWRDPKGDIFSQYSHPVTPRPADLPGERVGQLVLPQAIGLREVVSQNGQLRLPQEPGRHTVEVFVDEVPVSLTVFYLGEAASKKAPPPAAMPAGTPSGAVPRTPLPGTGLP